jgi:hypothetical protein
MSAKEVDSQKKAEDDDLRRHEPGTMTAHGLGNRVVGEQVDLLRFVKVRPLRFGRSHWRWLLPARGIVCRLGHRLNGGLVRLLSVSQLVLQLFDLSLQIFNSIVRTRWINGWWRSLVSLMRNGSCDSCRYGLGLVAGEERFDIRRLGA